MTAWVYFPQELSPGDTTTLVLQVEVAKAEYDGMTDADITAAINAQTEPDDGPIDAAAIRRLAIEQRLWGRLQAFGNRAFVTAAAQQDLTNACRNFLSLFSELEGQASLVRGNALWTAMDDDLSLMTAATGGGPVMTAGQANFMRALGDRTRQKWSNGIYETDIAGARQGTPS